MKKILISVLLLAWCLIPTTLWAAEVALGSSGQANRNQAISQASKQAQAQLLMQKASRVLTPDQLAANWERLSRDVFDDPSPYIKSTRTLTVSQQAREAWVLIEAEVDDAAFDKLIESLYTGQPAVKLEQILCLVSEDVAPGRPPLYWWSGQPGLATCPARVEQGLEKLGYAPFNPAAMIAGLPADITKNLVLNEEQAITLGEQAETGMVLWGRVRIYPILSQEASLSTPLLQLALLSVKDKRVLAQVEVEGAVFRDKLPAEFEKSMNKEVADALAKLFELAGVKVTPPPQLQIVVQMENLSSAAELARLERVLMRMEGLVTEVRRESLGLGKATLVVTATQNGLALAARLEQGDEFGWRVNVLERTPTKIRLSSTSSTMRLPY